MVSRGAVQEIECVLGSVRVVSQAPGVADPDPAGILPDLVPGSKVVRPKKGGSRAKGFLEAVEGNGARFGFGETKANVDRCRSVRIGGLGLQAALDILRRRLFRANHAVIPIGIEQGRHSLAEEHVDDPSGIAHAEASVSRDILLLQGQGRI